MIVAKTKWQRFRGLMFRTNIVPIVFPFPNESRFLTSIHSFFVFKPFKAIFVNKNWKVVDIRVVKPFRIVIPKSPCQYVIEVPIDFDEKDAIEQAKRALTQNNKTK